MNAILNAIDVTMKVVISAIAVVLLGSSIFGVSAIPATLKAIWNGGKAEQVRL